MTNEEAIDIICRYTKYDARDNADGKICQAYIMAISALEKQIPKKVSSGIDRTWGKETIEPVCPSCDYFLPRFQFIGDGKRVSYCEHCGQAIDWTEVE